MQKLELEKIQHIADLFFQRLHHSLSETDRQTLEDWLQQQAPERRARLEKMTDREQIRSALQYLYSVDTSGALADAQKKILADERRLLLPLWKPGRWLSLYKYTAAAVTIVAVIGTAAVLMIRKKQTGPPVAQHALNDVAPGGNKALLQLADGSRIVLDSAMNGSLARQGATRVIKLADGQLAYQATGEPSSAGSPETYNTITTPRGGQYAVVLPDGTKVWLNAASSLRFPTRFSPTERQVELSGEAYFEVAKNNQQPFTVRTGPMQVVVLGTQFDIEAYPDEKEQKATLLQGAVRVSAGDKQSLLQPGQQACLGNENNSALQVVTPKKASDVIAWKNGLFLFREDSIESVMRQVARWYDVDVVYHGKTDQEFFGKIPRNVPVSTLLKILASTGSVHFTIEGKKIIVDP